MSDSPGQQPQGVTNPKFAGGGGHEPDIEESAQEDPRGTAPLAGSGVDMKTENLPEDDD